MLDANALEVAVGLLISHAVVLEILTKLYWRFLEYQCKIFYIRLFFELFICSLISLH